MRALVVGVGLMGTLHARALLGSRRARLCGIVDCSQDTANTVGSDLGVTAFTDLVRAIESTQPDVAIVATPDSAHRESAETLIRAGVATLIEKPLATTLEDAAAIVGEAHEGGVRIMVGHLGRFYSRYIQVADAIHSGRFGKPVLVTTSTWGPRSRGDRVSATTNPLWHFGIHDIDTVQWITGASIEEIDGAQLVESHSGVSSFAAIGSLSSGTSFDMVTGWTLPDTASPRWDLKLHCEYGLVQATWSSDGVTCYGANGQQELDCLAMPLSYGRVAGALRDEVEHFLTAVAEGTPFAISTEEAVSAVRSAALLEKASIVRRVM